MTRFPARSITEVFDSVLEVAPDRPALVAPSGTLSYRELDASADAAAAALGELGVRSGDRVAASLGNDTDIVVAFHGAMRLGAVWVGVNRALAAAEKRQLLTAAGPSLYLTEEEAADVGPVRTAPLGAPDGRAGVEWRATVASCSGAGRPPTPSQDVPAAIAFTSGTTGLPKGIVHSQRNLLLPAAALVVRRGYDETLRKGDCLPLTILNMQVLTTLLTAQAGGCAVLTDRRDARGVAEWLARESVTVWNGVPAILYSMVHDPSIDRHFFESLREVWSGGGPCPEELFARFPSRFGHRLHQAYGLTEAPTVVTIEPTETEHVPGSCGTALPHVDVAICDEEGHDLPIGELGEVVVRAASRGEWAGLYRPMLGFWQDGVVEPFTATELRTGDLGSLDREGNLHVKDRKKLMILRGGANVYPAEVERVIEQMEGVAGCAVFGLPDQRLGQVVAAAVEPAPGHQLSPQDVTAHCGKLLARYKVPERVAVVGSLPRNAMGKVDRTPLPGLFTEGGPGDIG